MEKIEKRHLAKKSENFSQWYLDVVLKAELAEYAPIKGCQIFKPYGFAIWEKIQKILDEKIKEEGVKNAYFPLFIPESFLKKEKEHVEGFSPELAVVTIGGGEELKEKLIVRPTSETIIYETFSKWIKSWRDLPLKVNQWCNVVRWEKRPRLFLRTTEFLWQEGHAVFRTHKEAIKDVMWALKMYSNFYRQYLAIDGIEGKKSESEKFPGAKDTFTFEMLMPSGLALQGCTAHDLGQNFAKAFEIKFLDKDKKEKYPWQSCWGLSTRSIGALIMVHGDDHGLILPPKIAPIQVVIIPIFKKENKEKVLKFSNFVKEKLEKEKISVNLDEREKQTPGWKFNEWELKGVPLRIEIGEKEEKEKRITLVRRDNFEKISSSISQLVKKTKEILNLIQKNLFEKSSNFLKENTREINDFNQFKETIKNKKGFLKAFWCERPECEKKIKEETKATTRCLPLKEKEKKGKCVFCQREAKRKWIFAQAY